MESSWISTLKNIPASVDLITGSGSSSLSTAVRRTFKTARHSSSLTAMTLFHHCGSQSHTSSMTTQSTAHRRRQIMPSYRWWNMQMRMSRIFGPFTLSPSRGLLHDLALITHQAIQFGPRRYCLVLKVHSSKGQDKYHSQHYILLIPNT